MGIIVPLVVLVTLHAVTGTVTAPPEQHQQQNKTKRTVTSQTQQQQYQPHNPTTLMVYSDNAATPTGLNYFSVPAPVTKPVIFEPQPPLQLQLEVPKQVAAQQVLYEFEQTPTNSVSNVQVNQLLQPLRQQQQQQQQQQQGTNNQILYYNPDNNNNNNNPQNHGPQQFITGSETIASPVQHSSLIRHGQNFAQVQFQPVPQHIQTHQYIPGKYLYVNGKIIYQPNQQQQQPIKTNPLGYAGNSYSNGNINGYSNGNPNAYLQQKLVPPPLAGTAPISPYYRRTFHPPLRHQLQQITKPSLPTLPTGETPQEEPQTSPEELKEEEETEENDAAEESDDEDNSDGGYEAAEDDDDDHGYYNDDDDDDHSSYLTRDDDDMIDDDDSDSDRKSSRHVPKKHHYHYSSKPMKKFSKYNHGYKYKENYGSNKKPSYYSSSHGSGTGGKKKHRKSSKSHKASSSNHSPRKTVFRAVKSYTKQSNKPVYDKLEGKYSENVPVIHKNVFKEKWYVTKSTDDSSSL